MSTVPIHNREMTWNFPNSKFWSHREENAIIEDKRGMPKWTLEIPASRNSVFLLLAPKCQQHDCSVPGMGGRRQTQEAGGFEQWPELTTVSWWRGPGGYVCGGKLKRSKLWSNIKNEWLPWKNPSLDSHGLHDFAISTSLQNPRVLFHI